MSVFTSAARTYLARRQELRYISESSRLISCILMAEPLNSGDDVSAIIEPLSGRYIDANATLLLDL